MTNFGRRGRAVYSAARLRPLVAPDSVAIVGASPQPSSFGFRTIENLSKTKYAGRVVAVNPRHQTVNGVDCVASIAEVAAPVDCAIISVPAAGVLEQVTKCAESGVRSILIYTAGFAELGDTDSRSRQEALREIALRHSVPICGPNTGGMLNFIERKMPTFFSDVADIPYPANGNLTLISQSTGFGFQLAFTRARGTRLAYCLTCGNSVDVDVVDLLNFAVEDDASRVIGLVFEGIDSPLDLVAIGRKAKARGKAVIAMRLGSTGVGATAAQSHTGTLAAPHRLYQAAFRKAGIIEVATPEQLLEAANLFARAPHCTGTGVGIIASSGGVMVMAADAAERHGVALPQPTEDTKSRMRALLPPFASAVGNPTDLTAGVVADPNTYAEVIRLFADDPNFAAVVVPVTLSAGPATKDRPFAITKAAEKSRAAVCALWVSGWLEGPGSEVLDSNPRVTVFRSAERCFAALAAWLKWHRHNAPAEAKEHRHADSRAVVQSAGVQARRTLRESESRALLSPYGVRFLDMELADSPQATAAAAERLGFPVAVKIDSGEVPHRFRVGAVKLNIATSAAAADAYRQIVSAASKVGTQATQAIVAPMLSGQLEILIGASRDERFGPVLICSPGGVNVEELDEAVAALAPASQQDVVEMLRCLRMAPLLFGKDGSNAARAEPLIELILAASAAITSDQRIAEIDLNPVLVDVATGAAKAIDALVVLQGSE